jgi:D-sedoheptulose 7-phosphate isomerase
VDPLDPSFAERFLQETAEIVRAIDRDSVENVADGLAEVREGGGRLFILGVGGSAGHASHAVNDFRKLCGFEAYTPTDNASEMTARINDEGWDSAFAEWLSGSRLRAGDGVLAFSVGGGDEERGISVNLIRAVELALSEGGRVFGIVGRDGGYIGRMAEASIVVPPLFEEHVTSHTEGLCAVLWHLLVSHPKLQIRRTKWESMTSPTQP